MHRRAVRSGANRSGRTVAMSRTDLPETRVGRVVRVTEAEHESKREDGKGCAPHTLGTRRPTSGEERCRSGGERLGRVPKRRVPSRKRHRGVGAYPNVRFCSVQARSRGSLAPGQSCNTTCQLEARQLPVLPLGPLSLFRFLSLRRSFFFALPPSALGSFGPSAVSAFGSLGVWHFLPSAPSLSGLPNVPSPTRPPAVSL